MKDTGVKLREKLFVVVNNLWLITSVVVVNNS